MRNHPTVPSGGRAAGRSVNRAARRSTLSWAPENRYDGADEDGARGPAARRARLSRVHTLDLYSCTGTPTCLGCFPDAEAQDPASAPADGPAPATRAGDGGPAERPGERGPAPADEAPRLLAAAWNARDARDGEEVGLDALAVNIPEGTAATFRIYEADDDSQDDLVEQVEGTVRGGRATARWTFRWTDDDETGPTDFEEYRPPEYYFVAQCAGQEARSRLLEFRARVEHRVVDAGGQPFPDCPYVLVLPDGRTRQGRTDAQGRVVEDRVPPGYYRLIVGS